LRDAATGFSDAYPEQGSDFDFLAVQGLQRRLAASETRESVVQEARKAIAERGGNVPPALSRVLSKASEGKAFAATTVAGSVIGAGEPAASGEDIAVPEPSGVGA
jgi:hypothetical protein